MLNGDLFLVLIRLRKNGEIIQIKALMDIEVQAWLLNNQKLCELLVKRWRLPRTIHDHSAIMKELENKPIQTIRNFIPVLLQLNGRIFRDIPLLEMNLSDRSNFQIIIGLKFLARYNITLDCANKKLQIFKHISRDPLWQKNIKIFWNALIAKKTDVQAQKDMIRRNKKWKKSEFDWFLSSNSLVNLLQNISIILSYNPPILTTFDYIWMFDQKQAMRKMHNALLL
jgi:hypothetical protein